MSTLTAHELKAQGVSSVEERLKDAEDVIISVGGEDRYVVMALETYQRLREYELVGALQEARADVAAGRYNIESVAEHVKRLADEL